MLTIPSNIVGKEATFGEIEEPFRAEGFVLGGNWEFDKGFFDAAIDRDQEETIYLRLPVQVTDGALNEPQATLKFGEPFIVRHVVQDENASDSMPLVDQLPGETNSFVNQFQTPQEIDGDIVDQERRIGMAKKALARLIPYVH